MLIHDIKWYSFKLMTKQFNYDDCFHYYSWRNNVVIVFGALSSFFPLLHILIEVVCVSCPFQVMKNWKHSCRSSFIRMRAYPPQYSRLSTPSDPIPLLLLFSFSLFPLLPLFFSSFLLRLPTPFCVWFFIGFCFLRFLFRFLLHFLCVYLRMRVCAYLATLSLDMRCTWNMMSR